MLKLKKEKLNQSLELLNTLRVFQNSKTISKITFDVLCFVAPQSEDEKLWRQASLGFLWERNW